MQYLKSDIKNTVIEELKEKLIEYKDYTCYGCDLSYLLFETYNIDGSVTYNRFIAELWIKNNWDNLGEILEELKAHYDSDYFNEIVMNIWDNPEKFMVIVYLELGNYLLSQCKYIDKNWNSEVILNDTNIEIIGNQLEDLKGVI